MEGEGVYELFVNVMGLLERNYEIGQENVFEFILLGIEMVYIFDVVMSIFVLLEIFKGKFVGSQVFGFKLDIDIEMMEGIVIGNDMQLSNLESYFK